MRTSSFNYSSDVRKVLASLLLFLVVYLLLTLLAFALAAVLVFAGIALVMAKTMFSTIMISIGMMVLGVMLAFFMLKFIFTKNKTDIGQYSEIKPDEQPRLFDWIQALTRETGTPMPKKVYLSPEVNAAVFFDSSFLSMFFPVRKNLVVGLGLVNSVNLGEFKAIIAHEYGHFSQKSMRWGSYVFHTNKIIYNLLFENEGYANVIRNWSSTSGYFAIFALLNVKIVQAFQWVLQKVFLIVNRTNLSLSRQMEHHADAVSAMICGTNQSITALYRLEIAGGCYATLMGYYNQGIAENLKPDNLYPQLTAVMQEFCESNEIPTNNGLPHIDAENPDFAVGSRIVVKDPWSSHPSTIERVKFLKSQLFENAEPDLSSPWEIFENPEKLQKQLTDSLFSAIRFEKEPVTMDLAFFTSRYADSNSKKYPVVFKGYYSHRRISSFNPHDLTPPCAYSTLEELFDETRLSIIKKLNVIQLDLHSLQHIQNPGSEIPGFSFCDKEYNKEEAPRLSKELEAESERLKEQLAYNDKEICHFLLIHGQKGEVDKLQGTYITYFDAVRVTDTALEQSQQILQVLYAAMEKSMTYNEAQTTLDQIRQFETGFKKQIDEIKEEAASQKYLPAIQLEKLNDYVKNEKTYHGGTAFKKSEAEALTEICNLWIGLLMEREFRFKLQILQCQNNIIKELSH